MSDGGRRTVEPWGATGGRRRTALLVVLSLVIGLLGATGLTPVAPIAPAAAAAPGLVGRWAFDAGSGTTAVDSVGSKTATLTSGAGWGAGIQGASALTTNGTSGAAVTSATVLNTASSFTVSSWVKLNNLNGNQTFVSQDGNQISGFFLQLSGGKFVFTRAASDSTSATGVTATALSATVTGQWYHVVGVYSSSASTLALYVNGRLQQTQTAPSGWNATGNLAIGRGKYSGGATDWVNGTIDDVRVYNQALSASDVSHLGEAAHWAFDEGTGTTAADDTLSSFNATLTNGSTWGVGPVGASSVVLDGTNDFVNANSTVIDTSKSFTVSAWARSDTSVGFHTLLSVDGTNVSGFFLQQSDTNVWRFVRPSSDSSNPASYASAAASGTIATGSWYHLTAVYNSVAGTIALYVNGVLQTTVAYTTGFKAGGNLIIGRALSAGVGQSNFFTGGIDDVRVFPYVIDDTTATALAAPPAPPVPATPTATINGTTVAVSWVAPAPISGSPTTGYVVTPYTNGVAGNPQTFGTATSQNFTGAVAGSSYRYTVAAINANGTSGASGQSTAVSFNAPGTPTITAASASGSTAANLTWTAPSSNGGSAITGYRVTPYLGSTAQASQTFSAGSAGTAQSVTGLAPGTAYTFTVAAQNAAGYSNESAASSSVTTAAAAPATVAAPTATAGATTASVSWTAPSANGSPITGYVVTPFIGTTAQTATSFAGSTATTQQITGLTAGTTYTFTVAAINAVGTGTASPKSNAATVFALPGAPAITAVGAAAQGATLTWSAPGSNGGSAITGYRVTPSLSGVAQSPVSFGASAAGSAQTVGGLTAGKSYTFTVAAQNAGGYGAESVASAAVTPTAQAVPSPPPQATLGGAYSYQFDTTSIPTPYVWAVSDGSLPPGLTLSTSGLLSGTPTTAATSVWTVRVTYPGGVTSRTVTQVVAAAPVVTFTPATAVLNTAYSAQPTVAGGTTPFTWTVPIGPLPAGLSMSTTSGLISGTPTVVGSFPVTVRATDANGVRADRAVTLVVSTTPGVPAAPTATAGLTSAVLTWVAPATNGSTITAYVITPYLGGVAQTAITVDPSAKTRTLNGLTAGSSYTFTIAAVNANGTGAASSASNAVTPYAALSAPAITAVAARTGSATLSWTAPNSTGGSPVTGYVVTPFIGATAQTPQTFSSTATTQTVTGLTPGTAYTFQVAAQNASGATSLYRVNAGGPAVTATDEGLDWAADNAASSPYYGTGTATSSSSPSVALDSTIPAGTPLALFDTQRYDLTGGTNMLWQFPVTSGATVKVRLYFANRYTGTGAVGNRVFDVSLDGTTVLNRFDVVAGAGGDQTATMREFTLTSDGSVDIGFTPEVENPLISAIDIIQTGLATNGPQSAASTSVTPNASPTLTFAAPPTAPLGVAYSQQLAVTGGTGPFTWSVTTGTLPAGITLSAGGLLSGTPTAVGSSTFTVQVVDASGQSATRAVTLVVNDKPATPAAPTLSVSGTTATATWVAPAANGSPITGYSIRVYQDGALLATVATGTSTTFSSSGLTAGSTYTATVAAVNAVGTSAYSAASNAVVAYSQPGAPVIGAATPGDSLATVSWTAPAANGSAITGYVVTPYIDATAQPTQTFASTATTQTVTGLTAGTTYTFTVAAQNAAGTGPASLASAAVTPNANPTLTFAAPPAGFVGSAYTSSLTVNGGTSPFAWSVTTGTLPAGITLSSAGLLSGTPTTVGSSTFTVQVVDGSGQSATRSVTLAVYDVPAAPTITAASAGDTRATLGWTTPANNGTAITGYVVTPYIGATAQTATTFSGTTTTQTITGLTAGTVYTFKVAAQNAAGTGPQSSASSAVTPNANPTLTFAAPAAGAVGIAYSTQLTVNGGTSPYVWSVSAGTPPAGLSLSSSGLLSGTPTTVGSSTFTVQVVDASSQSATRSVTLAVNDVPAAPSITAATAGDGRATLTWTTPTSNGSAITGYVVTPYLGVTAQPATAFASTATTQTVTGLTAGSAYTFRVAAQNAVGTGPQSPTSSAVTPNANPTLTFAAPPAGVVGTAYSTQLTATGGTAPFTWSVSAGTLPAGVSLSSAGLLSGTPTAAGSSTFTVQVVDASAQSATRSVTLVVTDRPGTIAAPTATPGLTSAVLSWTAPTANGSTITGYVITPFISGVAQSSITVDPSAKTRTLNGLTAGSSYTFTVAGANANGTGPASPASNAITPFAALNAPTITAVAARTGSATLSWTAPTSTGGSPVTGYVVTPFIGTTAQTATTFASTATTQTITGLTPGTAYTFTVAARNASGTTVLNRLSSETVTAVDGGADWADNPAYRSGASNVYHSGVPIGAFDGTVPSTTPAGLFLAERWGSDASNEMRWAIPVSSGAPLKVRLYFANTYPGTSGVGARSFDVALEGVTVLPAFDPVAAAGGTSIATMRDFAVTSDGTVNIDFTHGQDTPAIYGIEIIQTGVTTNGPPSSASTAVTPNANPTLTFTGVPAGEVGVAYNSQLPVTGGTAPFTWSVTAGTLPAGLSLSSAGLLTGTPTAAGSSTYTVQVTDVSGQSASRPVTQTIAGAPSIAFTPASGEVGVAYSQQPTLTGGTSPFTWSISAGSLPGGLSIDPSTGLVSGTPTASGSFSVTLRAVDAFNQVATRTASLVIAPLPTLTSTPPKQYQQAGFGFTFAATGGTGPFTYAVVSGSLPPGLSLSSGGDLTGQTNQGSYTFTVRATDAKGQTADDPVTLVVDAPPVQVVKTASTTSVAPGGTVTFTLTATNISNTYYGNTHVYDPLADVLDDATYNGNANVTTGSVSSSGSTLDWAIPLNAGQSATLTYTVTVANPDTGNKLLTGRVSGVFSSTSCSSGQQTSACTAAVTVSGLSITKTASVSTTTPGSVVTFSIVVTNTGQTPYPAATFSEDLSAGILDDATYGGNATATSGSLGYNGSTLTWTGPLTVGAGAGASATISYSVTVANPDPGNRSLTGTVVSSTAGSTCPSGSPGPACSATVTVLIPALSITHTSSVTTTTPGGSVAYTVVLANTGQTPYTATSVTLDLTGVLDDAAIAGGSATSGSLVYNAGAGTSVWTGDIAVGATVTISGSVTVANPDTGDKVLTTIVTSAAAGSTCPVGGTSSACRTTVQVLVPALSIAASSDVSTTTPGSVVHFSVLVTNTGQTPYTGAAFSTPLTGVLDDATFNGDLAASVGSASYAGSTVSWTGDLAVGASATITYAVTVRTPDPGNLALSSTVVSTTPGNNCRTGSSDAGCTVSVTVLIPSLSISTVVDAGASTTPGTTVRYTTTVLDSGQTTYTGVVVVLDQRGVFDDATFNLDGVESSGTTSALPDGTLRWVLTLAPGQSATATATFRVNDPPSGDKTLASNVTSTAAGSSCPTASAAPSCRTSVAVLIPRLTVSTSATPTPVTPGDPVSYTISVANTGETAYGSVTVTDDLTGVLGDAVYAGGASATSGGTPTFSGSTLSWTGPLAFGATTTITFSVTVRDPDPGNKRLVDAVLSNAAGSNCAAGSSDSRCSSAVTVLVPGLTITKSADAATTVPGARVVYTVTVTNSGATAYTGASFSDPLGGVLDDADYAGDATVASGGGTVGYAGSSVSWSGALAVGGSATVTYSVTVHAADGGDNRLTNTVASTNRGNSCPTGGSDPRCTVTVPVARLVLIQTATESTTTPGSVVHVSTTFTNTGQVPYVGISVVSPRADTSDDTVPTGDQTASSGSLVRTADAVTWTGDIGVGGVVTSTRTLIVKNPDPGNKLITATLQSSAPGNNCPTGTADPRCTFAVTVLVPGLSISKVASTTTAVSGDTVGYTIRAHNTGQTSYPAATLNDALTGVLDDATYDADASASSGSVSFTAPTLTWTGALAVGQTVTITYSVTVKAQPADKTMVNPVTSDAVGNNCPAASNDPACLSIVVVLTPGLTIVKTADVANATLGSTVTYTVQVTNSGQTPYASASFSDALGGVLDDASYDGDAASTPSGTVGYGGSTLSWSGALAPGASATVTYSVTIRNPSSGDRNLTNTVVSTSTGSNCPTGSSDSRCTVAVAVTNAVTLTLTKTADVLVTAAGKKVTYTVTAVNSSSLAILAANFSDPLADVVDDATYDNDATVSPGSGGSVNLVSSTLVWVGNVSAHTTVTVTYSVTVHGTATGNQVLAGELVSTSPAVSNSCLAGSADPRCTSTVPVAALVIQQAYTEPTTTPGSLLHLTVTFTNTGQADYRGISITSAAADTFDDANPSGDQVATSGTLVLSTTALTWTGDIPVGGSVTITASGTVKNPDPGNKRVTNIQVSSALGNNCPSGSSDPRCTALSVVQVPQLTLTSTADKTAVVPGEQVGYTLTIRDTGETAYTGATLTDALAGVLDDAVYGSDAVASAGAVAFDGTPGAQQLSWTGDLALGQTVTVTYSVTARQPATGDKSMVSSVSSTTVGSTCLPGGSGSACHSSVDVLTPALALSTTASPSTTVPGAAVTFSVTATNSGQTDYPAGTQIVLPLGGVTDDAVYAGGATSSSGALTLGGGALTWTGAVAMGATVTISYTVTVSDPVTGDHLLQAGVRSSAQGSNCATGSTDPRCAVSVPVASLHLSDVTNVSVAQPTTVVRFTETYTNTGQVPFYGIRVTIDGRGVFDDATYNGDATPSAGSLTLDAGTGLLTWTGDLAVGASVTTTGSVTVDNPTRGDKNLHNRISTTDAPNNCRPDSTDPACVIDVPVLTPRLSISQTADTTTTTPGSVVGYTLTIANAGETSYAGATATTDLSGVLDDAQLQAGAQASSGQLVQSGSTLTWTGDLGVGASATITYSARVRNPEPGDLTMVGRVSSDAIGSSCPSAGTAPSCSSLVVVLIPALDITVTPSSTTTYPGGQVGYTLTIHNTGQAPYTGAGVTAALVGVLDDATYRQDGQADVGTVGFAGTDLTWTGDLAVDQTATVTYSVTVSDPDQGDKLLVTSVSSAAPGSTCTTSGPCTSSVVVQIPSLAVYTTADVATATPGDRVTFTITMTNNGQRPYLGTVTTASLSDVLDKATFDGRVTSSSGLAFFSGSTITWVGNIAVGAQVTVRYTVTAGRPVPGDQTMSTTVQNASAGSPCRAGNSSTACTRTVQILIPSLALALSSDTATTTPGSVVRYTVLATNDGEASYVGAVVTDDLAGVLPDAAYDGDAQVTGGGQLAYGSGRLTWTGNLPVGATARITFSVTVNDPDTGDRVLLSAVSSAAQGSPCPSGSTAAGCVSRVQVLVPGLRVSTGADRATVVAGSSVGYTVTLQNTGETAYAPATASWSLADVLDDGTYPGDAVATSGTVERTGNTLAWSGALALGQTVTITYSVGTAYPTAGDRSLNTIVRSTSAGSTCVAGTEAGCATHVTVLVPALTVTKAASTTHVVPGGRVGYTVTATNTGEAAYPAAALVDDLSGVLDHATYAGDATVTTGTVGVAGSALTWTGGLGVGDSVVITYSVVVNTVVADPAALVNRVSSTSVGSTCPVGNGSGACGTTTVIDPSTLELRNLTTSFTLSGIPGSTVSLDDAVVGTVVTNSISGYSVSVRAVAVTLDGQDPSNDDTIPVGDLAVRRNGSSPYTALSTSTAIPVYSQDHASAPDGDAVSTDYQVQIPDVASGTYTVTVEYVVTSQ